MQYLQRAGTSSRPSDQPQPTISASVNGGHVEKPGNSGQMPK
jgi:hypothetical protein